MIQVELQAATVALKAFNILTSPLVLPKVLLDSTSSSVGLANGLLAGIASSKEEVKAVTSALSSLYAYYDISSTSSDLVADNMMVAEYNSEYASEMVVFKTILKMTRTRLNVGVL